MFMYRERTWQGAYKIPWDDRDFSRRMLREHLSQDHDLASRRNVWIERQVAWIHERILCGQSASILDLGCGPGLYTHRLAARGHQCCGIDFGPASIEYAQEHNPAPSRCMFLLGDIRLVPLGGPYDLAMMLFGEFNVFSPIEIVAILRKIRVALRPEGRLIVEMQAPKGVESVGHGKPSEQMCRSGLFSDRPYHCRTENQWRPDEQVAIQTFTVTETPTGPTHRYRSTTQAWGNNDLVELLANAGFRNGAPCTEWPCNTDALTLWLA